MAASRAERKRSKPMAMTSAGASGTSAAIHQPPSILGASGTVMETRPASTAKSIAAARIETNRRLGKLANLRKIASNDLGRRRPRSKAVRNPPGDACDVTSRVSLPRSCTFLGATVALAAAVEALATPRTGDRLGADRQPANVAFRDLLVRVLRAHANDRRSVAEGRVERRLQRRLNLSGIAVALGSLSERDAAIVENRHASRLRVRRRSRRRTRECRRSSRCGSCASGTQPQPHARARVVRRFVGKLGRASPARRSLARRRRRRFRAVRLRCRRPARPASARRLPLAASARRSCPSASPVLERCGCGTPASESRSSRSLRRPASTIDVVGRRRERNVPARLAVRRLRASCSGCSGAAKSATRGGCARIVTVSESVRIANDGAAHAHRAPREESAFQRLPSSVNACIAITLAC